MFYALLKTAVATILLFTWMQAGASPWVETGDMRLRSDIQLLADAGVIKGAVTIWPLAWANVMEGLDARRAVTPWQRSALARLQTAATRAGREGISLHSRAAIASEPIGIRGFADTPREEAEITGGIQYISGRFAANLQATWANNPDDDKRVRADGSYAAVLLGNWSLGISAQNRWWGPGWSTSMIYSHNARPVPSIVIDRHLTTPFSTKWLSWLGHWDLSMGVGQLESDRGTPNALLYSMRVSLRPIQNLDIGLSRVAQLCGDGRSCGLDTWKDMLLGKDNAGDNVSPEDEPGNQLAGWDVRWSATAFNQPFALYTQWVGEDEGGGLPAKYTALMGAETWLGNAAGDSYRIYLEWSDTMCNFALYKGSDKVVPDCAYNNSNYPSGLRYRDRPLASAYDNDASIFALGLLRVDSNNASWLLTARYGNLNRKGLPESPNTVATNKTRYREALLTHRRNISVGELHLGAGYEYRKDTVTRTSDSDLHLFLEWRTSTH